MAQQPFTNIDLRQLKIFKTVVECSGFAAAEVSLNISGSAISVAISDLEKKLNLTLCQRGRAGFVLTDEGQGIYEAILQLFTALETFRAHVHGLQEHLSGTLTIGIADNLVTMEHMTISKALYALKEKGPDVQINITMAPPKDIESGVIDGALQIGVVPHIRSLPALCYHRLYDELSHLYCSHSHPLFQAHSVTIEQIQTADMVVSTYAQSPKVKEIERAFRITATATDREGVAFLIFTGAFIGFLPTHYAKLWMEAGQLKALRPDLFSYTTDFAAITRQGARPNRVLETFMDALTPKSSLA